MSKATKEPVVSAQDANDSLNKLQLGLDSPVTFEEAFSIVEKAETSQMADLSSEYFTFDKEGVYLFAATGVNKITIKEKEVEVVELMDKEKNRYVNGDKVLVSAVKKLTVLPCFIKVEYVGKIKNANGVYKDLKVYTFSANIAK